MMSFPVESLKGFLGRDIVDYFLEWEPGTKALYVFARCVTCGNSTSTRGNIYVKRRYGCAV